MGAKAGGCEGCGGEGSVRAFSAARAAAAVRLADADLAVEAALREGRNPGPYYAERNAARDAYRAHVDVDPD